MSRLLSGAWRGPLPLDIDTRVWVLERLVLQLSKHITVVETPDPSLLMAIEELKARHPDV